MTTLNKPELYFQYKKATKMTTLLNGIYEEVNKVSIKNLEEILDIDKASGEWLDRIGMYLNYERPFYTSSSAFQYDNPPSKYDGNYFYDSAGSPISDEVYRILLKSEIFRRNSNLTIEDIRYIIKSAFGSYKVNIIEGTKIVTIIAYFDDEDKANIARLANNINNKWFGLPTAVGIDDFYIVSPKTLYTISSPYSLNYGLNNVWVTYFTDLNSSSKIDVLTNIDDITGGVTDYGIETTFDSQYVYILNSIGVLSKVDVTTNSEISSITIGSGLQGKSLTYGNGFIWVCGINSNIIYKINVTTMTLSTTIDISDNCGINSKILYFENNGEKKVFITSENRVTIIDAITNSITSYFLYQTGSMDVITNTQNEKVIWSVIPDQKKIVIFNETGFISDITINDSRWLIPCNANILKFYKNYVYINDTINKCIYKLNPGIDTNSIIITKIYTFPVSLNDMTFEDDFMWVGYSSTSIIEKIKY